MDNRRVRALTALRRLRHVETDAARRDLAACLAEEAKVSEREDALQRELGAQRDIAGDFDREIMAAYFRGTHQELAALRQALAGLQAKTAAARAELGRRRAAETVAEDMLADVRQMLAAEEARRDQITLEDVSRALAGERDSPWRGDREGDVVE